jgi:DNA-binding LacI/PurR family transcriptional regulator
MVYSGIMRNVTIEDVANHCGVSRATVSRVLNDEARVKPSTITKVRNAVITLGYTPNSNARALSGGKTKTVGILLPGTWRDYYNPLLKGMDEVSSQKGYFLLLRSRNYLDEAERIIGEGRADGLIIRNMNEPERHDRLFRRLAKQDIPFVLIGNPLPEYPSIKIDNVGGARKVAHHFAEHRFKKVLFISGPKENVDSNDRYYGFKLGLAERGRDPESVVSAEGDYSMESGYTVLEVLFPSLRPDAVFAANDRMALGALLYFRKHSVRVPEDAAVIGFDDTFFSEYLTPSLTTVRQPIYEMGMMAMETMVRLLQGFPVTDTHIILPTRFILRESCGCKVSGYLPMSETENTVPALEEGKRT